MTSYRYTNQELPNSESNVTEVDESCVMTYRPTWTLSDSTCPISDDHSNYNDHADLSGEEDRRRLAISHDLLCALAPVVYWEGDVCEASVLVVL